MTRPVIHSQLGKSCCSDCTVISPPATPRAQTITLRGCSEKNALNFLLKLGFKPVVPG